MPVLYRQMPETPEEKVRFEEIYLKHRGAMFRAAEGILRSGQDAEDADRLAGTAESVSDYHALVEIFGRQLLRSVVEQEGFLRNA